MKSLEFGRHSLLTLAGGCRRHGLIWDYVTLDVTRYVVWNISVWVWKMFSVPVVPRSPFPFTYTHTYIHKRAHTHSLELIIRVDQGDFVRLLRVLADGRALLAVLVRLHHLLRGLLRVLLVGWREVVDGVLHHVSRIDGLFQSAGDAVHGGDIIYKEKE